jgi:hypothetical protein
MAAPLLCATAATPAVLASGPTAATAPPSPAAAAPARLHQVADFDGCASRVLASAELERLVAASASAADHKAARCRLIAILPFERSITPRRPRSQPEHLYEGINRSFKFATDPQSASQQRRLNALPAEKLHVGLDGSGPLAAGRVDANRAILQL